MIADQKVFYIIFWLVYRELKVYSFSLGSGARLQAQETLRVMCIYAVRERIKWRARPHASSEPSILKSLIFMQWH